MMTFVQKKEGVVFSYSMTAELFNPFHHNSGEDAQSICLWKFFNLFYEEGVLYPAEVFSQ